MLRNSEKRCSSVVTSLFYVLEDPVEPGSGLRPGLDLLIGTLVRNAACKIYVPYPRSESGPSITGSLNEYPPGIQSRIEIVDKEGADYGRIKDYLKPVHDELEDPSQILAYNDIVNFLYKLLLGSKFHAEADVSNSKLIGRFIQMLGDQVHSREAKSRLDQLLGIYSGYLRPLRIDTFTLLPMATEPSMYPDLADFLNEAEVIELSETRFLAGIPDQAKAALIKMREDIRRLLAGKKYSAMIRGATELIQIRGATKGVRIRNTDHLIDAFEELHSPEYAPPLVDLDRYRMEMCGGAGPGAFPGSVLTDGTTGIAS